MLKKHKETKPETHPVADDREPASATRPKTQARLSRRKKTAAPRSKSDRVLALLTRPDGASLEELMKATGWQAHSVRGFLSGAVKKRKGLMLMSAKEGKGIRRYRIEAEVAA